MSTLEKKIADVVLKRIRTARSNRDIEIRAPESEPKIEQPVTLREARFSDLEQVSALTVRFGLSSHSAENWKRLWVENPALADGETPVIGWVLEAPSGIVGFLGSIRSQYEYERETLRAVATCAFAVDVAYRAFSHLLLTSFFRQRNVDLFLNTTATVPAGKMMMAFKAAPLPQKDYGQVLFWVIDPYHFAKSVFTRMRITSGLPALSFLASLGVRADVGLRRRAPRATNKYTIIETGVNDIGEEFERFWSRKSKDSSRLRAKRDLATIRWHFNPPGSRQVARVLGCYSGNHLLGYAIVRHYTAAKDGLRRTLIADLMIEGEEYQVVEKLLAAIHKSARNAGSHILEVMGFPKEIRQIVLKSKPYSRNYPACPFFFKARDGALHERLTDENAWYACPFDGDGTIWP